MISNHPNLSEKAGKPIFPPAFSSILPTESVLFRAVSAAAASRAGFFQFLLCLCDLPLYILIPARVAASHLLSGLLFQGVRLFPGSADLFFLKCLIPGEKLCMGRIRR